MEIALQCGLLTLELGASLATVICRVHEQGPLCLLTYNSIREQIQRLKEDNALEVMLLTFEGLRDNANINSQFSCALEHKTF